MKVGSSLVSAPLSGHHPGPELAEAAVRSALAAAGLERAEQVILLLSRDFSRNPQPAILAAARTAGTTQVDGCTASGLFTERGWQIDQPAAAALVFAADTADSRAADGPRLAFSGHGTLPFDWQSSPARAGLLDTDATVWVHGRQATNNCAEIQLPCLRGRLALSTGLRILGKTQTVDQSDGYELRRIGGQSAAASLTRALPAELRQYPPLHQISALRQADKPGIDILSVNADGSMTLAAALDEGESITWAIRQPLSAEQEMREKLLAAVNPEKMPNFALMFSCIGRGPLFYGNDDRDLLAFREQFPGTPLLGAYGCGQIAPSAGKNRLFHNAVITLLFESSHV